METIEHQEADVEQTEIPEYAEEGARLQELREEEGYSREQIELMVDVGVSSLSTYENGQGRPGEKSWAQLYAIFGDDMPDFGHENLFILKELAENEVDVESPEPPEDAQRLRAVRKFCGHSLQDTAEFVDEQVEGLTNSTHVRNWEMGLETPSVEQVEALHELFDVSSTPDFGYDV